MTPWRLRLVRKSHGCLCTAGCMSAGVSCSAWRPMPRRSPKRPCVRSPSSMPSRRRYGACLPDRAKTIFWDDESFHVNFYAQEKPGRSGRAFLIPCDGNPVFGRSCRCFFRIRVLLWNGWNGIKRAPVPPRSTSYFSTPARLLGKPSATLLPCRRAYHDHDPENRGADVDDGLGIDIEHADQAAERRGPRADQADRPEHTPKPTGAEHEDEQDQDLTGWSLAPPLVNDGCVPGVLAKMWSPPLGAPGSLIQKYTPMAENLVVCAHVCGQWLTFQAFTQN